MDPIGHWGRRMRYVLAVLFFAAAPLLSSSPRAGGPGLDSFSPPLDIFDLEAIDTVSLESVGWELVPPTASLPNPILDEENNLLIFKGTFNAGLVSIFPEDSMVPGGWPAGPVSLASWRSYLCDVLWEVTAYVVLPSGPPDEWGPARRFGWVGGMDKDSDPQELIGKLNQSNGPQTEGEGRESGAIFKAQKNWSFAPEDCDVPTIQLVPKTLAGRPVYDGEVVACGAAYGGNCPPSLGHATEHRFQAGTSGALDLLAEGEATPEEMKTHVYWLYARMQMIGARVLRDFVGRYVSDYGLDPNDFVNDGYFYHGGSFLGQMPPLSSAVDPLASGATYGGARPRDLWGPYGRNRLWYLDDYSTAGAPPEGADWCEYNLLEAWRGSTYTRLLRSRYFHENRYRHLYPGKTIVDRSGTHDTHYMLGNSRDFFRRGTFDSQGPAEPDLNLHPLYLFNVGHGKELRTDDQRRENAPANRDLGQAADCNLIYNSTGQRDLPRVFVKDVQFNDPDTGDGKVDVIVTVAVDVLSNRIQPGIPPQGEMVRRELSLYHADSTDRYFGSIGQQGDLLSDFYGNPADLFRRDILSDRSADISTGFDPGAVCAADFDGEGDQDLAVADLTGGIEIYLNDGFGGFAPGARYPAFGELVSLVAADLNGDSRPDLAASDRLNGEIEVLINSGSGFDSAVSYSAGQEPVSIAAVDVNGDSKVDLVAADRAGGEVQVLINTGAGVFASPVSYSSGSEPVWIEAADLTGNGAIDLAVADKANGEVLILANNGAGVFGTLSTLSAGTSPVALAVVDLDGKAELDLVAADDLGGFVYALLSNGGGSFSAGGGFAVSPGPIRISAADLDGEGDMDVAVLCETDGDVSVLRNLWKDGADAWQGFAAATDYAVATGPADLVVGDLDGMGDLDLATVSSPSGTLAIRRSASMVKVGTQPGFDLWEGTFTMSCGMQTAFIIEARETGFTYDPPVMGGTSEVHIIDQVAGTCDPSALSGFPPPWIGQFPVWIAPCP